MKDKKIINNTKYRLDSFKGMSTEEIKVYAGDDAKEVYKAVNGDYEFPEEKVKKAASKAEDSKPGVSEKEK